MKIRTPIPPIAVIDKRKQVIPFVMALVIIAVIAFALSLISETIQAWADKKEAVELLLDCWNGKWVGESGNEDLACLPLVRNRKK